MRCLLSLLFPCPMGPPHTSVNRNYQSRPSSVGHLCSGIVVCPRQSRHLFVALKVITIILKPQRPPKHRKHLSEHDSRTASRRVRVHPINMSKAPEDDSNCEDAGTMYDGLHWKSHFFASFTKVTKMDQLVRLPAVREVLAPECHKKLFNSMLACPTKCLGGVPFYVSAWALNLNSRPQPRTRKHPPQNPKHQDLNQQKTPPLLPSDRVSGGAGEVAGKRSSLLDVVGSRALKI